MNKIEELQIARDYTMRQAVRLHFLTSIPTMRQKERIQKELQFAESRELQGKLRKDLQKVIEMAADARVVEFANLVRDATKIVQASQDPVVIRAAGARIEQEVKRIERDAKLARRVQRLEKALDEE